MRKIYTIIVLSVFGLAGYSQQADILEESVLINDKYVNSWTSYFKDDIDLVRKSFIRFSRDNYDLKTKKGKKKNLILEQVSLPEISDKRGDLFAIFTSEKKMTKLSMVFFIGYDIPLTSTDNPQEMLRLRDFYKEFALYYRTEYFNLLIEENQKRLKDLSSELRKNQNELKALSQSIKKAEKAILKETSEDVKFELNNKNIESRSRTQAIHEIVGNLKEEINRVSASLKQINKSIQNLQNEELD